MPPSNCAVDGQPATRSVPASCTPVMLMTAVEVNSDTSANHCPMKRMVMRRRIVACHVRLIGILPPAAKLDRKNAKRAKRLCELRVFAVHYFTPYRFRC